MQWRQNNHTNTWLSAFDMCRLTKQKSIPKINFFRHENSILPLCSYCDCAKHQHVDSVSIRLQANANYRKRIWHINYMLGKFCTICIHRNVYKYFILIEASGSIERNWW